MSRISDEKLDALLAEGYKEKDASKNGHVLTMMLLQELKERRESDSKLLDIKDQLRLVRDRCPTGFVVIRDRTCPGMYSMKIIDMWGDCPGKTEHKWICKECWDKALEGEE